MYGIVVDKDILVKLLNEGILEKADYGINGYVYANSIWMPATIEKTMRLLTYDDDFFECAYFRNGKLDSDRGSKFYFTEKGMSPDEIAQFIRDTSKKFADTYLQLKNRETMMAIDSLS